MPKYDTLVNKVQHISHKNQLLFLGVNQKCVFIQAREHYIILQKHDTDEAAF